MTDAHNHLQAREFDGVREDIIADLLQSGVTHCVVNATCPSDWSAVASLAQKHPDLIIPSFGIHPWYVSNVTSGSDKINWLSQLRQLLRTTPFACLGECGLDHTRPRDTFLAQRKIWTAQLQLATEEKVPISIHCVRAWGPMLEILESSPLPQCGFLLHGYNGSAELTARLTSLGAYFSCSGAGLHPSRQKLRDRLMAIPPNRLLVESDAPHMRPPEPRVTHPMEEDRTVNHPANVMGIQSGLSEFLDTSQVNKNFKRLFLSRDQN